tara:strand:- start:22 stop:552 length:531 start_codon:yes stop_codon:yes gene_type:complete
MAMDKIQSESINLADTFAFTGTVTGAGGTNTPSFFALLSSSQTGLSDAATVKLAANTEVYDNGGVYDNSSNYRFTPGVAGKYFIYAGALVSSGAESNLREAEMYIYKNGSSISKASFNHVANYSQSSTLTASFVNIADDNDYYEVYVAVNTQSGNWQIAGDSGSARSYFGAYKIIE